MSTPDAAIGTRVRRYRHDRQLSLTELASLAGVSKSHLSAIENGSGSRPGARVLYDLAEALGVTTADLMGRSLQPEHDDVAISPSLLAFAQSKQLPAADVAMLAAIQFRGDPPRTQQRWQFIYAAITTSSGLDQDDDQPEQV